MPQAKITKRRVDGAESCERDTIFWDTELRGFGLKVTTKGTKTYLVQYRMGGRESPTRRKTIGRHGSPWTPDSARKEAKRLLRLVDEGSDPMALEMNRRREAVELAFEVIAEQFIEKYAKRNKSWRQTKRIFDRHITPAFSGRPLPAIKRREIARLVEAKAERAPSAARLLHAHLRKFFRWAVDRGDIEVSPMAGMTPPPPAKARDRVLGDDELARVWRASDTLGYPFGPIVRLLVLTGARRAEIGALRWDEVGADEIHLTGERTKSGQPRTIPLSPAAKTILDGLPHMSNPDTNKAEFVFTVTGRTPVSGWSKAKRKLDEAATKIGPDGKTLVEPSPLAPWRMHDLRRTLATGLQRLGVRLEVTEAVLGHISGSRAGIVGVYQRHDWAEEKRAALDAWSAHVECLIDGKRAFSNVIRMTDQGAN